MNYDIFLWFIEERESIRIKKDAGFPRPWTEDFILHNTRFCNINRFQDRGSLRLIDFVQNLSDWDKVFYTFLYRSCYSSPRFLRQMTGSWFDDLSRISQHNMILGDKRNAYQIFLNKDERIIQFLTNTVYRVTIDFYKIFNSIENASILEASDKIANIYNNYHGMRLIFLSTEIAKDLSYFFPERINPDSECHMNVGALKALKLFPGRSRKSKIQELQKLSSLQFSSLEHGLCEINRWYERGEFYRMNGYFKKSWLY